MSLEINTLLQLIPTFDTNDHTQVYRFVRSCDAAFQLASEDKSKILLVYALNKISGVGASDVHSRQYSNWEDLKIYLIDRFSQVKTIAHLNLELQSMFQKPNESITDYFHRVDLCRSKIIEKLNIEINDKSLVGRILTTEETALNVFINGLSSDIGIMLRTKCFDSLTEAGRFAQQEGKIRDMNNARQSLFKSVLSSPRTPQNAIPRPPQRSFINNSIRYPTQYQNKPNNSPNINTNTNYPNSKFCNYCKNPGHIIAECRKRTYNNNLRNQNNKQLALPAPPANVNNLNSQPTNELSNSLEIDSASCSMNPIQTLTDLSQLQL